MIENLKSVTKDSAFYSISNLVNKIVGFILLPLYTSYFAIEEYGLLALFDTIIDFMNIFSAFGIVEAFKRWYWEQKDENRQKSVFTSAFIFSIFTALIFSLILYFVLIKYSKQIFDSSFSNQFIVIYILSIIANIIMQRVFILLRTQRLAALNMKYNIIRTVITLSANIILIIHFKMGIESVFLSRLIGIIITLILLLPRIIGNLVWKLDFVILKMMLKFSLPLAISSSLSLIFTLSDRWLLKGLSTMVNVGQYSLAYRITNLIRFLVINSFLQAYVYTFFQKMNNPVHYNFFKKIVTYFTFTTILIGLVLIAYSKEIIMLLAKDPDYYVSYTIIPILMIAILFSGLRQILILPFYKYKQSKFISVTSIIAGLINIILNILLIPRWNSYGAASATAIAHLLIVITYYIKSKKFKEFSYETKRICIIIISGFLYIALLSISHRLTMLSGLTIKSLILVSYPVILYLSGFFTPKEIDMFKKYLKKAFRKKNL